MKKIGVNLELLQKTLKKGTAFALAGSIVLGGQAVIPKDNSFGVQTVCAAEQNVVNLDVQMGVNLYMNDKGFVPTDVNGNETYPFIYEGTTYVPVRAIAQLFNATINWDEQTKTVIIATTGESAKLKHTYRPKQELYNKTITAETGARLVVNGQECIPTDVNGNVKDIYIVNGTTYVPVRAVSEALDLPITWSDKSNSVFIGLHKTTGLTVENMTTLFDTKVFEEKCDNFYQGHGNSWFYTFVENEDGIRTSSPDEFCGLIICYLNDEYYEGSLYKTSFAYHCEQYGIGSYAFRRGKGLLFQFTHLLVDAGNHEENQYCPFNWDSIVINPEYVEFLNRFQYLIYQCYVDQNYDALRGFLEEYMYGTEGNLHYKKCHPLLDYFVSACPLYTDMSLYMNGTQKGWDFYKAYKECEAIMSERYQEVYDLLYGNTLTK